MKVSDLNRKEWLQGLAWLQHASEYDKARLQAALEDLIEALNEQALVLSNLAQLKGPVRSPQNERPTGLGYDGRQGVSAACSFARALKSSLPTVSVMWPKPVSRLRAWSETLLCIPTRATGAASSQV